MSQSKLHSFLEAWANVLLGYGISTAANFYVLPLWGWQVTVQQALEVGLVFTLISLVRSYALRRFFNLFH